MALASAKRRNTMSRKTAFSPDINLYRRIWCRDAKSRS